MKLRIIPGNEVIFNPESHSYLVDGREAVSVTTILKEVGISEDFSKMPESVLKKVEAARIRGNAYDMLAEDAIKAPYDLNDWQLRFLEEMKKIKGTSFITQKRLGAHLVDENNKILLTFAGSPDIVGYEKNLLISITDVKATYQINEISVTWQTNMYSIMEDAEEHNEVQKNVIHFQEKVDTFTTEELKNINEETIILMLKSYLNGKVFIEGEELTRNLDMENYVELRNELEEIEKEIRDFTEKRKEKMDEIKNKISKFEKEIETLVDNAQLKQIETAGYRFKLTRPSTRKTVSYQKIYEKYEDIIFDELIPRIEDEKEKEKIQKYMKEIVDNNIKISEVKGSFQVTKITENDEKTEI